MHETVDHVLPTASRRHPALGIIGGGQLARMTAMAALRLGCEVSVLERQTFGPAANLATHFITGDWNDPATLRAFAAHVDVVTFENEFVDAASLIALEEAGVPLFPTSASLVIVQDKLRQKEALQAAGLPVAPSVATATRADVTRAAEAWGWPLVLKARRDAYDGKGNATLRSAADVDVAWERLGGDRGRALYVERFCPFVAELAIITTRGRDGRTVSYPVVETVQRDHICHVVKAPADVPADVAARVQAVAERAIEAVGAVGSFGVELFLQSDGEVVVNELAPRVHNSGHYTIEACACSQFENHVRAVMGWPLGDTTMRAPAAVMINLLGTGVGSGWPSGLADALGASDATVHLYGKRTSSPGRKMGHVTALGATLALAERAAVRAASRLTFGGPA